MSVELWKTIFDWATVVLIAFTVVSGAGALITGNIITKRQEAKNRQFETELTSAKTELGKQQVRAANADSRVAGLEQDVATAKTEMAKQQTRAANAEVALLQLQTRLAHRRISPDEQAKLAAKLRPFAGSIVAVTKLGESEAGQFADDLLAIFQAAKWQVQLSTIGTLSPPQYGLLYAVDESSPAGKALARILADLPTATFTSAKVTGAVAAIVVGLKSPA